MALILQTNGVHLIFVRLYFWGRMKKPGRTITALLLTTIYLLMVSTPLAPLVLQSKMIVHAVTGECSGDCRIDGCSAERSAAHTCCCWQKKNAEYSDVRQQVNSGCCGAQKAARCETLSRHAHDEGVEPGTAGDSGSRKQRTIISSAPCGNGKLFTLSNGEITWHLPFSFLKEVPSPEQSSLTLLSPDRLLSRHGDPPDPPPIITFRV